MSELVSQEKYHTLDPKAQGYVSYRQATKDGSEIPESNPYREGTEPYRLWAMGHFDGMLEDQESEDNRMSEGMKRMLMFLAGIFVTGLVWVMTAVLGG